MLPEKQPRNSPYGISVTQNNSVLSRAGTSSKTRIRWTQDLHKRFVECINHLGGADSKCYIICLRQRDVCWLIGYLSDDCRGNSKGNL